MKEHQAANELRNPDNIREELERKLEPLKSEDNSFINVPAKQVFEKVGYHKVNFSRLPEKVQIRIALALISNPGFHWGQPDRKVLRGEKPWPPQNVVMTNAEGSTYYFFGIIELFRCFFVSKVHSELLSSYST